MTEDNTKKSLYNNSIISYKDTQKMRSKGSWFATHS